jgi:predicted secreted protein
VTHAVYGLGATLSIAGTSIANVDTVDGVELARETQDATAHDSSAGWAEKVATLKKVSDLKISGFFYPGDTNGQVAMATALGTGTLTAFVLTYPSTIGTVTMSFSAIVTAFKPGPVDVKNLVKFTATLAVSGAATLGITASTGVSALTVVATGATVYPTFSVSKYYYVVTPTSATSGTWAATFTGTAVLNYGTTIACTDGSLTLTSTVASGAVPFATAPSVTFLQLVETDTGKAPITYYFQVCKTT